MIKIVCISDTHCKHNKIIIPECDILIHAGDYSFRGEKHEIESFYSWLNIQKAKHVISVQGNHELGVEANFESAKAIALKLCPRVHFMEEGLVTVEGLKIWTSAWTPFFCNWAWNAERGDEIKKHWDLIPNDIDILVTHGPPAGILDETLRGEKVGCYDLLQKVMDIKPKIHVFGHIHETYGQEEINGIKFINASICDESYRASNLPVEIEL